eukprot:CAMPEP_0185018740 /NCGR_PEP_ID=MMETSP1103-20130426/1413_1 /TAXON_ID=36769 /ORGANISM="Paraphysomonas bandaiensis, Strain Caron Lab Isolate" /LENGTH=260 /DNA_ID=CAMNT_0027548693 /DNA_START=77 /DNA_END=855 /DNA_ORIENTATION=-
MSNLDMVADGSSASSSEWKHLPKFDQFGVVNWTKRLRVWLMRKNRNHLGLEERPHRPADNASTAASVPSSEAVQPVAEALEIVDQYFREKDMLPPDDPDKEMLASELVNKLVIRFRGETQYELVELNKQFASFRILQGELVCTAIDRLNGIVQKMTELGEPPTDVSKKTKLQTALETRKDLEQLYTNIYLKGDISFNEMITICRRFDQAKGLPQESSAPEVHWNSSDQEVTCSYSKCGKRGHTQKNCWMKKKDLKISQMK